MSDEDEDDIEYEMTLRVYSTKKHPHIARVAWETSDYSLEGKSIASLPAGLNLALRLTMWMNEERKRVNAGKSVPIKMSEAELEEAVTTLNEGSPDAEEPEQPASRTKH